MQSRYNKIRRLLLVQAGLVFIISLLLLLIVDSKQAYSVLLAGLVYLVPSWIFAVKLFKHEGARAAGKIVRDFYWGESLKLLCTFALFALVFKYVPVAPLAFFCTYIFLQMTLWIAPLLLLI